MENVHVLMVIYHLILILVLKVILYFILNIYIDSILDKKEDLTTISTNYKSLLGGKCITNQNCRTLDARCLNYICTCPNGYFGIDDWNCLKDSGRN
jgi:hypothetical protein